METTNEQSKSNRSAMFSAKVVLLLGLIFLGLYADDHGHNPFYLYFAALIVFIRIMDDWR